MEAGRPGASAELLENFSPLMLGDQARAVMAQFEDPVMRELVKDMSRVTVLPAGRIRPRARRLSDAETRCPRLARSRWPCCAPEAEFTWEMDVPAGRAAIERWFLRAHRRRPCRWPPAGLRSACATRSAAARQPRRTGRVLVGTGQAMPLLASPREPDAHAQRFNSAAARRFVKPDNLNTGMALASSGTGAPLPCPMLDLFVAPACKPANGQIPKAGRACSAAINRRPSNNDWRPSLNALSPSGRHCGVGWNVWLPNRP